MPSEELIDSLLRNSTQPKFSNSRDYKGEDFTRYISPRFYRGGIPPWTGLIASDIIRKNGELIALNKPALGDIAMRGYQVSPIIPEGVYKNRTLARCYFWKDGKQIMKRYRLISLKEVNPQQITDQVLEHVYGKLLEWSIEYWDSKFMNAITFGMGEKLADGLELIKRDIEGYDVYALWVEEGSLTEPLTAVVGREPEQGLLESLGLTDEELQKQVGNKNALPLLLAGAGLVTGNLWLSGLGLLLRFRQ